MPRADFFYQRGEIASVIAVFSLIIITLGLVLGYTASQQDLSRKTEADIIFSSSNDTRWFRSESGGACTAYYTCTAGNVEISHVSLGFDDSVYDLGEYVDGVTGVDRNGNSPEELYIGNCAGGDEGIAITMNPDDLLGYRESFREEYGIETGDEILVTISQGGGLPAKYFVYDRPAEVPNAGADGQEVTIELGFYGTTAGNKKYYLQTANMNTCGFELPITATPTPDVSTAPTADPSAGPSEEPTAALSPTPTPGPVECGEPCTLTDECGTYEEENLVCANSGGDYGDSLYCTEDECTCIPERCAISGDCTQEELMCIEPTATPEPTITSVPPTPRPTTVGQCTINSTAELKECADPECRTNEPLIIDDSNATDFSISNDKDETPGYFETKDRGRLSTQNIYIDEINPHDGEKFGSYEVGEQAEVTLQYPSEYQIIDNWCNQANGGPCPAEDETVSGINMTCGNGINYGWTLQRCEDEGSYYYGCVWDQNYWDGFNVGDVNRVEKRGNTILNKGHVDENGEELLSVAQVFAAPQNGYLKSIVLDLEEAEPDGSENWEFDNNLEENIVYVSITETTDVYDRFDISDDDVLAFTEYVWDGTDGLQRVTFSKSVKINKDKQYAVVIDNTRGLNRKTSLWRYNKGSNCIEGFGNNAYALWLDKDSNVYHWMNYFTTDQFLVIELESDSCQLALAYQQEMIGNSDVNNDGIVNMIDYQMVVEAYMNEGEDLPEDVNKDGKVDAYDITSILMNLAKEIES